MAESGGAQDAVGDDEMLYRRVPRNDGLPPYYHDAGGQPEVLAQAFSERPREEGKPFAGQYRLSVDRAKLCGFDPELTRRGDPRRDPTTVGVVEMPVADVRAVPGVADVIPDPIQDEPGEPDNPAHALICIQYDPAQSRKARERHFREVRQALADVANSRPWPIHPPE